MSKNCELLKNLSDCLTEEVLQDIVRKEKNLGSQNVEIISWDFGEANAKGDSYLSVVSKIHIKSRVNDNLQDTKIVVKSLPRNSSRKKTFRSTEFFYTETMFYSEVYLC